MSERKIYVIGGSKKFGSGKVISKLVLYLHQTQIDYKLIETQGARFNIISEIYNIPKNSLVIYQPSICFPAFLRDIVIVIILYLRRVDVKFLLLVDIKYKNILFRNAFFRRVFFSSNIVFGLATPSLPIERFEKVSFFFESNRLQKDLINRTKEAYALVHFGYKSTIKGWDSFYKIATQFHKSASFCYIGGNNMTVSEKQLIRGYKSETNIDIEHTLKTNFDREIPVYLFCSHEDFAPLMILECAWWGVPIICIKDTEAEYILTRFISSDFFISVEANQLDQLNLNEIRAAAKRFSEFLKNHNENQLFLEVMAKLMPTTA